MQGYYLKKLSEEVEQDKTIIRYDFDLFYPEPYYVCFLMGIKQYFNAQTRIAFSREGKFVSLDEQNITLDPKQNILQSVMQICKEKDLSLFVSYTIKDKYKFSITYKHNYSGFGVCVGSNDKKVVAKVEKMIQEATYTTYLSVLPCLPTRYLALKKANALNVVTPRLKAACLEYIENIDAYLNNKEMQQVVNLQKDLCEKNGYCDSYTKEFILSLKPELEQ